VIEVRMSQGDCLKLKTESLESFHNPLGFITRIDANCLFSNLAANDPSVLFEGGDGDLFNDHCFVLCNRI
jgi:hypothetical protein